MKIVLVHSLHLTILDFPEETHCTGPARHNLVQQFAEQVPTVYLQYSKYLEARALPKEFGKTPNMQDESDERFSPLVVCNSCGLLAQAGYSQTGCGAYLPRGTMVTRSTASR